MRRIIALHLLLPNKKSQDRVGSDIEMVKLWYQHIRECGAFDDQVSIIVNHSLLDNFCTGLDIIRISPTILSIADIQLLKIKMLLDLHSKPKDVMMLDLDILAVGSLNRLFDGEGDLRTASSFIGLFDRRHAGFLMPKWKRHLHAAIFRNRESFNTCVMVANGDIKERLNGAIEGFKHLQPFPLGDQTLINFLAYRGVIDIQKYCNSTVQHSNWSQSDHAILWHFPVADRLGKMRELSLL